MKLPNGRNSGGMAKSSRSWPTTYHATVQRMAVPTINACKTANVISYKLRELFVEKKEGLEYASGASEKFFKLTPSRTVENALLASRANMTFMIIDL